jgi:hypothetical protein
MLQRILIVLVGIGFVVAALFFAAAAAAALLAVGVAARALAWWRGRGAARPEVQQPKAAPVVIEGEFRRL